MFSAVLRILSAFTKGAKSEEPEPWDKYKQGVVSSSPACRPNQKQMFLFIAFCIRTYCLMNFLSPGRLPVLNHQFAGLQPITHFTMGSVRAFTLVSLVCQGYKLSVQGPEIYIQLKQLKFLWPFFGFCHRGEGCSAAMLNEAQCTEVYPLCLHGNQQDEKLLSVSKDAEFMHGKVQRLEPDILSNSV